MKKVISGIDIEIEKKNIKNMHLYIYPPKADVKITSPLTISDKSIEIFVRLNLSKIKQERLKILSQPRLTKRQYISGETYYLFGKQYFFEFKASNNKKLIIKNNKLILQMKEISTIKQKEKVVRDEFKLLLIKKLDKIIPKWSKKINLYCNEYNVRYFKTKWGTCNPRDKRIWINLQMVSKPVECLEYVVLHELIHLKIKNHGPKFIEMMDKYMPNWRDVKKALNEQILLSE